jgi:predicted MFS family arabinose efflux permease
MRVPAIGIAQILAWGASFYLPAVLSKPTVADTGWPLPWVVGAFSLALLVSGLVSPRVGDLIEARGGRPVLATGAATIALGLVVMALAPNLAVYVAAWAIVGVGMGAGLYDAAFSALGRLHGLAARREITNLTLVAGFASTVSWPLAAVFVSQWGWRGASLAFAALLVVVAVPLYLAAFPREARREVVHRKPAGPGAGEGPGTDRSPLRSPVFSPLFMLTAAAFTLSSVIASVLSVHLMTLMEARGVALAAAVGFGALIGPAQVAARIVESVLGARYHPLWTMLASTLCVAIGVVLLWTGMPALLAAAFVFYGAGMGIKSIARGTLPLALFGADGYAPLMGRMAMPILVTMAVSPSVGAVLIERTGADATIGVLVALALIDVALVLAIFPLRPRA